MNKTIYDLELHDWLETDAYNITRVPGGWIYRHRFHTPTLVFIPFDNEFQCIPERAIHS